MSQLTSGQDSWNKQRQLKPLKKQKVVKCACGLPTTNVNKICVMCCLGERLRIRHMNTPGMDDFLLKMGV